MYSLYIMSHLILGLVMPMALAVSLPISTIIALATEGNKATILATLKSPIVILSALISLYLLISSFYSLNPAFSSKNALQFSALLLSFAILWGLNSEMAPELNPKEKQIILGGFIFLVSCLCLLSIAINYRLLDWVSYALNRQIAMFSLFFWPLSLYFSAKKHLVPLIISYILVVVAIALSNSETALLMFLISSIIFVIFHIIKSVLPKMMRTIVFSIASLSITITPFFLAYINSPKFVELIKPYLGNKIHHYNIWVVTLTDMINNLPFGIGIGAARFFETDAIKAARGFKMHHPHNYALELSLELGLFGFLLIALISAGLIWIFHKAPQKHQPAVAAGLISILVLYTTTFSFWQEWRTGAMAFTLILIERVFRTQKSLKSQAI